MPPSKLHLSYSDTSPFWRKLLLLILLFAAAIFVFLWALPLDPLLSPKGAYLVGTANYSFIEPNKDVFQPEQTKNRELAVQVWYPASATTEKSSPYMAPFKDFSPFVRTPLFAALAAHLPFVKTHAFLNAPISSKAGMCPVIIFSHGLMGGRIQNTSQVEELASHGFVVAAPDHTHDASFSVFPDGHVVCSQLLIGKESSNAATLGDVDLDQRIEDVRFLINELKRLNQKDEKGILTQRLDLDRVGVFGHSLGGSTAIDAAQRGLVKAALAYDGGPRNPAEPLCPLMIMQASREGDPLAVEGLLHTQHLYPIYNVTVARTGHANFTDLPLITPLHWIIQLSGPIDQAEAEGIINAYTLAFFDKYLLGKKEDPAMLQMPGTTCTTDSSSAPPKR